MIIQKEFAGFDGTMERLDLLALDTSGRLVIIENKLDDSGRDVIWQALKYAAYCSTLKTSQIIEIYGRHLGNSDIAQDRIAEFLGEDDTEGLALNPTNSQRTMLVAAQFRREVTATALWLLGKGVNIACFQVTPYQTEADLFLDVTQIIPTPETADYMIQLAEKSASDEHFNAAEGARHKRRREYWTSLFEVAAERGLTGLAQRTPGKENWMSISSGISGVTYTLVINSAESLAKVHFQTSNKELNKTMFDLVQTEAERFADILGSEPDWLRSDDTKSSRIILRTDFDGTDPAVWPDIINWHLDKLARLERAMEPLIPQLSDIARSKGRGTD